PLEEGEAKILGELPLPLSDIARPDVLVAQSRETAKEAVLPKALAGNFLFPFVEAKEGADLPPIGELHVLAQILIARLEAVGSAVLPAQHLAQRSRRRMLHLEDVLIELRRQRLQLSLVGDVVVARNRLVQPTLARLPVIVHGRNQHVARVADEVEDPYVVAVQDVRVLAEVRIAVEQDERLAQRLAQASVL